MGPAFPLQMERTIALRNGPLPLGLVSRTQLGTLQPVLQSRRANRAVYPQPSDVTRLLQSWSNGDKQALRELVPHVYRELRALAASYIRRERLDHTLQPTALVPEAYLRMVDQTHVQSPNRAQV